MFEVTSLSHYMTARFPGGNGSRPWVPQVIGVHATRPEAERHIARIATANFGRLPSNRTYAIRAV